MFTINRRSDAAVLADRRLAWKIASDGVDAAYRMWARAAGATARAVAYDAYVMAVEREARAAQTYCSAVTSQRALAA